MQHYFVGRDGITVDHALLVSTQRNEKEVTDRMNRCKATSIIHGDIRSGGRPTNTQAFQRRE